MTPDRAASPPRPAPRLRRARSLMLCALIAFSAGCRPKTPQGVADRFVDAYFVEMDQSKALPLSSGLARAMIERELRDVSAIRRQMGALPSDTRPEVYYRRTEERAEGQRKMFRYDITLKLKQDVTRKKAELALAQEGTDWRVVFFHVGD